MASPAESGSAAWIGCPSGRPSTNALKYGLTVRTVVLPNENADEAYIRNLQPTAPVEMDLITGIGLWNRDGKGSVAAPLRHRDRPVRARNGKTRSSLRVVPRICRALLRLPETLRMLSDVKPHGPERTYTRVLNTLPRLRAVRESNLDTGNKDSAKRTESQERTPSANLSPPAQHEQIPRAPPPCGANPPRSSDPRIAHSN